jgi:hypothetical protein
MTPSLSPLDLDDLQTIAPIHLYSARHGRYQGEEERVQMEVFAPEDQGLLKQIYRSLLGLSEILKPFHDKHADCREALSFYVTTSAYQNLTEQVAHLGHATSVGMNGPQTDRLVHDLRGGAFQALSFRLQLFAVAPDKTPGLQSLYFLVRDHLKIMRNCVEDLDAERFYRDSISQDHDAQLLVDKWSEAEFHAVRTPVQINLECYYQGTLCESCLEFSSLDRIIYNLMNNAARYTADGQVYFYVVPIPEEHPENVRFVVANLATDEQRRILTRKFGNDLTTIFEGGFTTGGHGIGTRICADFCAHAYGIHDFDRARQGGYFGARWIGDYFAAWFHWPVVGR